ncbi:trypsin eta [Drosophila sulfurigaster albostrigata]|uniref:trypsin eta n=1 Tax=Drosophila sulfurigaster albostrigata TaxID=89887 RepID=UPI002D21CB5A|nr:trypsin eta [Drosophila sulfurigaster albostrigata]
MRITIRDMDILRISLIVLISTLPTCVWLTEVKPEGRIVNGSQVDIARHPYCVSLRYRRSNDSAYLHECAGIIYSERAVVTAAQCLADLTEDTKLIVVGAANKRNGTDGVVYPAANWTYHPQFNYYTADYDIGVVILDTPFDFSYYGIRQIGVREERPATGRNALVIGWGYQEEWGPSSPHLEQTSVPIVGSDECNSIYGAGEVTERMICAGNVAQGGNDACQGDTGGPLIIDEELVGLVSWGRGCGRPGYPTVYTYVASFKSWINETLQVAGAL